MSETSAAEPASMASTHPTSAELDRLPGLGQVALMALIAIAFAAFFLGASGALNRTIWQSDFVVANRWTIPALVLLFSLLVGLLQKYLSAPTVIEGGFAEMMKGDAPETDSRAFPGT